MLNDIRHECPVPRLLLCGNRTCTEADELEKSADDEGDHKEATGPGEDEAVVDCEEEEDDDEDYGGDGGGGIAVECKTGVDVVGVEAKVGYSG